jgi:hypothetical protein
LLAESRRQEGITSASRDGVIIHCRISDACGEGDNIIHYGCGHGKGCTYEGGRDVDGLGDDASREDVRNVLLAGLSWVRAGARDFNV